jgi:murein L,D-transpeptidase YcbB/YkuD
MKFTSKKSRLISASVIGLSLSFAALSEGANHHPLSETSQTQSAALDSSTGVTPDEMMGENDLSKIAQEIEHRMVDESLDGRLTGPLSSGAIEAARIAYAQAVFQPLWKRGAAEKLKALPLFFESHGLDTPIIAKSLPGLVNQRFKSRSSKMRAEADLRLTFVWLNLTSSISGTLSDEGETIKPRVNAPARSELVTRLTRAAASDPLIEMNAFAPKAPQYNNLRRSLDLYQKKSERGGWKAVPIIKETIELGESHEIVPAIRQRLTDEGYLIESIVSSLNAMPVLEPNNNPALYDAELEKSVRAFQKQHGLNVDGIIGPTTLRVMNISAEAKVKQIKYTLDAWRDLDSFESSAQGQYIWANIPSFSVEGWNNGIKEIAMDTIVGAPRTPTPAFSDEIEYIVVNPKWFLPISLFKRQKLRKLKADPSYAEKHHYKIYDRSSGEELNPFAVDWNEKGISRKIQMVQQPGSHNALGELKIIFPNKHSVYLHSTPQKKLFEQDIRAFSSGCIRLDDPAAMANWITNLDDAVDTDTFNRTLNAEERERFYLNKHVPVHITYMSVTADESGMPIFHRDIYNRYEKPDEVSEPYIIETPIIIASLSVDESKQPANPSGSVTLGRMPK